MASFANLGITKDSPAFIVAEVSGNHDGILENALKLINAAKEAGAQAVKFQTYTADSLSVDSDSPYFKVAGDSIWRGFRNTHQLYRKASTPLDWLPTLFKESRKLGILPFSSPFDEQAVDILEGLGCEIYKIASPEINHLPLIEKIAGTGKPAIFSLGVAPETTLEKAILAFAKSSKSEFALLQCDTRYPAREEFSNIALLCTLQRRYNCLVGISDHTTGEKIIDVSIGAGAKIFEKHIKLNDHIGIDKDFSLSPQEFKSYVRRIRNAEQILGKAEFRYHEDDDFFRKNSRSIFASADIEVGQQFSQVNVRIVRPGYGLDPSMLNVLLTRKSKRLIKKGEPILIQDLNS